MVHQSGYIYNDIKSQNVVIDIDNNNKPIATLIDLGLATKYKDENNTHIQDNETTSTFRGNIANSSLDCMNFFKSCRKDDFISLFLMITTILNGDKPVGSEADVQHLLDVCDQYDNIPDSESEIFIAYRDYKEKYTLLKMADVTVKKNMFLNHQILKLNPDYVMRHGETLKSKYV